VVFKLRKVISVSKNDLGSSQRYNHLIHLKDLDPVYVKQFPLKPDHQSFIEATLESWLKIGVFNEPDLSTTHPFFASLRKRDRACASFKTFEPSTQKQKLTNTP
jgi:hypothetical protein